MARILEVGLVDEVLRRQLSRSFQSGNVTFLIGSGASLPAIPTAGAIEAEITALLTNGSEEEAYVKMYEFLKTIQEPTNKLINTLPDDANEKALAHYEAFLRTLEEILLARRTTLLPRQATIFSTNYDLFVEKAAAACPTVILNDGFGRASGLTCGMEFSSRNFFRTTYNTGNLYEYKVEVPCINLIKLHGSFSWLKEKDRIVARFSPVDELQPDSDHATRKALVESYAVILPQASKFRETLMDRTYYDLLRIYANTLDRENTVLLAFGFSFGDEHIRDITTRALKNPTLRLMIFAYNQSDRDKYRLMFDQYSNVEIITAVDGELGFTQFNHHLKQMLHPKMEAV